MRVGLLLAAYLVGRAACLSYDGHLSVPDTKGGLFGGVAYGDDGWFGVDGYPAKIIRVKLGNNLMTAALEPANPVYAYADEDRRLGGQMSVTGRLELLQGEERLWCIVPEPRDLTKPHWYAYVGVGVPAGRLVKVDLLGMKRVGYVDLTAKDVRAGLVHNADSYFVTSSRPAVVMRCPVDAMFHGDTFRPVEVTLAPGEHDVQTIFADHTASHIVMGTYTQPAQIIRLRTPSMERSASLTLPTSDSMIYAGARWEQHGIFVTSTLPGRLLKVSIEPLSHQGTVVFSRGEDRAVSVVVHGRSAFVGFANDWEQHTSSVVQVDLFSMIEVGAIVTPAGASWLYTGISSGDFAFFGSRYHDDSKIVRVAMVSARPDVPKAPEGHATGQDAIKLSWKRPFELYHTGGSSPVGARILVRPSWHWDWTQEHVFGRAAPDPAAPSTGFGRIVRYHEDPKELLDGGYGAIVTGLDAMETYKFAVIVTNDAGSSHRSRSGGAIGTSFSATLEVVMLGTAIMLDIALIVAYCVAWLDRNGRDVPGERYDKAGTDENLLFGVEDSSLGVGGGSSRLPVLTSSSRRGTAAVGMVGVAVVCVLASWMQEQLSGYLKQPGQMGGIECIAVSVLAVASVGAMTWCCAGVYWARIKRENSRLRLWAVVASGVLWASVSLCMTTVMAWSGFAPSPQGMMVCITVTWQLLALFFAGAVTEAVTIARPPTVGEYEQDRSRVSLAEAVMAL